jgi:hypothetical protein
MFLALIIICIAFSIVFALPKAVHNSFLFSMSARLVICLTNVALGGQLPGAQLDANKFFADAIDRSYNPAIISWNIHDLLIGADAFVNVNALVQNIGGPDFLLSHSLSLLGSALCLYTIAQIWALFYNNIEQKELSIILLIYSITPSVLTNQSYILREVWQSLCILGIAWAGLSIQLNGFSNLRSIILVGSIVAGSFLHNVMPVTMALLTILSLALANRISVRELFRPSNALRMVLFSIFAGLLLLPILSQSALLSSGDEGLMGAAETYSGRAIMADARADYGALFKATNPLTIIPTFLAYQLMPIPGKITSIEDVIAFGENLWRLFLLQIFWRKQKMLDSGIRHNANMFLLMWFVSELIWSVGTVNWGTATRHHVAPYGLLLIIGSIAMNRKNSTILKAKLTL